MKRLLAIAFALMLAGTARAAGLPQLRTEVASASGKAAAAKGQRVQLQGALDQVARQIEARKAAKAGKLFGDAELDALLKQSQSISSQMTEALKAENEAEELLRGGQARMLDELDAELARLRARWDAARTREERQGLVGQLKSLRAERDSLRRAMPAAAIPQLSDRPSDDPDELLERADALLDGEDKLRREEQALTRRIQELKAERDLERRMNEFLSEDALFDESDRRLSVTRTSRAADSEATGSSATGTSSKTSGDATPSAGAPTTGSAENDGAASLDGRTEPSYGNGSWTPGTGSTASGGTSSSTSTPGRQDGASTIAAPRVDVTKTPPERRTSLSPYSEDEGLEELLGRRAQLQKVADEMHKKATEAAEKAKALK